MTISARGRVPRVTRCALRWRNGDHDGETTSQAVERRDSLGCGDAPRGGNRPTARRREALLGRRPAARDTGRRASHPLRVHDRRVCPRGPVTMRARDLERLRAALERAPVLKETLAFRETSRPLGDTAALGRPSTQARVQAGTATACAAAASTRAASRSPPSADPRSGSTACSGCGMSPITLPASFTTPATLPSDPFTSSW